MAKPLDRCVYCAYVIETHAGRSMQALPGAGFTRLDGTKTRKGKKARHSPIAQAPLAVEIVETPNGPRPLCERHARDAVRAGESC